MAEPDTDDTDDSSESMGSVPNVTQRKLEEYSCKNENSKSLESRNLESTKLYLQYSKVKLIVLILVVLLVLVVLRVIRIPTMSNTKDDIEYYSNQIFKIKGAFKWPSVKSWKILNISLHNQIFNSKTAEKPTVIILAGMQQPVDKLYLEISNLINHFWNGKCSLFKPSVSTETDVLTKEIHNFVSQRRKDGTRCIYVPQIDHIPPNLGPSLHGLTDELNALYTDMIYLFSVIARGSGIQYNSKPAASTDKEIELFVVDILRKKWEEEMGEERFVALISRLCVNVVGVLAH